MQEMHPDMTTEESAASLGLATRLSEQLLMSQVQPQEEMPVETSQDAPQGTETPVVEEDEVTASETPEIDLKAELEVFKKEMKEEVKQQVESIRQGIKEALDGQED